MNRFLILTLCCIAWLRSAAQEEKVVLSDLRTPSAPAFTILGVQPSEISRPKSWNELEASLFSNFANSGSFAIPTDVAMEVSPYWLFRHENLTFENLTEPGLKSLLHNAGVSVATGKPGEANPGAVLGLGLRTMLDLGKPSNELRKQYLAFSDVQIAMVLFRSMLGAALSGIENERLSKKQLQDALENEKAALGQPNPDIRIALDALIEELVSRLDDEFTAGDAQAQGLALMTGIAESGEFKASAKALENSITDRKGFKVELALATKMGYPTNTFEDGRLQKVGMWITPSYQHPTLSSIEVLGVLRYVKNNQDLASDVEELEEQGFNVDFSTNIDYGGKLVFKKQKFSLSAEVIGRAQEITLERFEVGGLRVTTTADRSDIRWAGNFTYQVSDKMNITYTYGENFDINTGLDGNLISLISLGLSLGAVTGADLSE